VLSDPSDGTSTVVQGRNAFATSTEPTIAETNIVHLAWDVMVGLGTLLSLLSVWYAVSWLRRRDLPKSRWFLRVAAVSGVLSIVALEAGWVVTEVGRQPWIVRNYFKVQQAATTNHAVWLTFTIVVVIYLALGTATILILSAMSRRWRAAPTEAEPEAPYGPREPVGTGDSTRKVPVG
jgi:cytochrome d ubiquinol oxidase subunit I